MIPSGALGVRFGDDSRPVGGEVCREIEAVAHGFSRHFALEYVADGTLVPSTEPPGWPRRSRARVRLRAGSVGEVRRRPDGLGVLALDSLDGVHLAARVRDAVTGTNWEGTGVVPDIACQPAAALDAAVEALAPDGSSRGASCCASAGSERG